MRTDTRTLEEKIADRNAKIDAVHEKLTSAVEQLVTGDDWLRAIGVAARFRSRSFNNGLLVWVQHAAAFEAGMVSAPELTYVAGFQQWKGLGRSVRKSVAGYQILAPRTARMASRSPGDPASWRRLDRGEKPQPGETVSTRMIGVRLAYVWDISGTEGPDLPTRPEPRLPAGQAPPGLWDGLARQVAGHGLALQMVADASALGGALGLTTYGTRLVQVAGDLDDLAKVYVLAHELAHVALHQPGRDAGPDDGSAAVPGGRSPHRGIREVEADSVAYMLLQAHDVTVDTATVPYVSGWASSVPGRSAVEVVQETAARVRTAAVTILDRLNTAKTSDGTPPGLERTPSARGLRDTGAVPAAATVQAGLTQLELPGRHQTLPLGVVVEGAGR